MDCPAIYIYPIVSDSNATNTGNINVALYVVIPHTHTLRAWVVLTLQVKVYWVCITGSVFCKKQIPCFTIKDIRCLDKSPVAVRSDSCVAVVACRVKTAALPPPTHPQFSTQFVTQSLGPTRVSLFTSHDITASPTFTLSIFTLCRWNQQI